ncbi:penicillin-binding protein 1C [Lysobacter sp. ISL-52]|uniref:penicillin-binding protein 1C n=2 Tax=Lysobacter TaxID=68 RepID=UPI001BE709CB|nr:penicillin-binding protein 1C [Lysobacter sp. ISL-52]MBT2747273.1 penicillin-binding protein 1C [Lysobacter sp. ISL-42]MBT2753319.1 penicillin-binding protein 1C [Lysobacter sp. ISL-50]MBT2775429.1 penicillin-binding protein 1C [Lysobacter sp. ISL-54]MBT2783035.1 penicillin-binding protein 1C [Lysobacter sp. ISL-52]
MNLGLFRIREWRRQWVALALSLIAVAAMWGVIRFWPRPSLSEAIPLSTVVRDREGRLLRLTLASDQRYRLWVPLKDISPRLVEAVMLQEDAWFRWHPGFNPVSLLRGAWSTYGSGEARVGGSTLTMQLARLRWRLQTRDVRGKLVQIARAVQLELCYSKDDILEAYLNFAPYGGNIEGVGAASLIYYRKPTDRLTLPESLALAVLPQAPSRRGKLAVHEDGSDDDAYYIGRGLQAARARLYARWRERHPEDAAEDALLNLPLRLHSARELPFRAPHLVDRVLAEQAWHPEAGPELKTTLDTRLQRLLEERVRNHLQRERSRGLRNASAILIDTRDMGVRALVGSVDYFDASIQGQVNGSDAKRSPGSTLKPFIYALALDQGVLHPQTVLRDVPSAFGPYTPENFDGRFMGPVTATEALVRSRNIPAVYVASQLKQPGFYDFLRQAGVSRMASKDHYGLALVLGGGEVTMNELARMYAMLGNDGRLRALRWRESDPQEEGARLISAEAAFITRDMLRHNPRPDAGSQSASRPLPVAWKTGTSWAFRDAWSAGIVGPYVLVVWMGNFDGASNPALVGVEAAAPLFFDIVDGLQAARVDLADPVRQWPINLKRVEVCRASGDLPNAWCPQRGMTWFIPGKSPIRISTVHRAIALDKISGRPVCGRFDPSTMRTEVFEFWPSDLAQVFVQAGIPRKRPPSGHDCGGAQDWLGSAPSITSPYRATRYTMRLSHPDQVNLSLTATVDADVSKLYWFVGNTFIGSADPGKALAWTPDRTGQFRVSVVDDRGRSDEREIEVAVVQ